MYTIEEFDKQKTKVLKYIIFKKRTEYEVRQKFQKTVEKDLLEDIIQDLKENKYICVRKLLGNEKKLYDWSII